MTVDMNKYEELLQQFGGISQDHISREALESLKEKYRSDIHSKRALSDIVDISSLLEVLKKRGVIQYNDISALQEINNEYVRDESIKRQIDDLITSYNQLWQENSGSINFLYSSGKSNVFLVSHKSKIPETLLEESETAHLHNRIDKNLQTSTEDMTKESLLKTESLNNLDVPRHENETDRNNFYISNLCPLKIVKKRDTTVHIRILILILIILFGPLFIWILINLFHGSAAVVPGHPSTQAAPGQSQSNMPFHMTSTTAAYSTQSTFSANHVQFYSTPTSPPVDREIELRKIVVKELSKKIGYYWKDVCRGLDLNENTIDEITIEYLQESPGQKFEKMFKKGMTIYFSEPRPQWKDELLRALKTAKRVDLQEKAQGIINNYSNL